MRMPRFKRIVTATAALAAVIALALYVVPLARHRSQNVAQGRQWASLLKKHPAFSSKPAAYAVEVAFSYAAPTDENLQKLRSTYDLDTVAGGPETERLINLLRWVYQLTGHANEPEIPEERNALNLMAGIK